jgi:hypothetical protein
MHRIGEDRVPVNSGWWIAVYRGKGAAMNPARDIEYPQPIDVPDEPIEPGLDDPEPEIPAEHVALQAGWHQVKSIDSDFVAFVSSCF